MHTTHKTLTRPEVLVIEYAALLIAAESGLSECLSRSDPIPFPLAYSLGRDECFAEGERDGDDNGYDGARASLL